MSKDVIGDGCKAFVDVQDESEACDAFMFETDGVDATKSAGAALALRLRDGDFIALCGDLGAGKTQFVQGVASALGVMDDVISPTFNILLQYRCAGLDGAIYEGPAEIDHFDLYRLEDADELDDIDYFGVTDEHSPGVSFVEWADKFEDALPDDYLRVSIKRTGVESRILLVESCGLRARALARLWLRALQAEQVEIEFNVEDSKGGSCRGGQ